MVALGPVSEQEKAWLIAHAGAVVYPSVYEGFGLVPFESALDGVPCVFAPQSSLAEEAPEGTAAIVPWDPGASAAAAHALLTDPSARAEQVHALAAAARGLTWTAAASRMVEIYREAAVAPVRDAATLSRDAVQREGRLSVEHQLEAARLIREREHAQRMYDELNAEVGFGLSLIGPHGALPEGLQRALLALSAHPALSRPLFGVLSRAFLAARALGRAVRGRVAQSALSGRRPVPGTARYTLQEACPPSRQPFRDAPRLPPREFTSASRSPRSAATRSRSGRFTRCAVRATKTCTR